MTELRDQLVRVHGEEIVQSYESLFPNELDQFDNRYCGVVGTLESWGWDCYENSYSGFDDDVVPEFEDFMDNEFSDYYLYDSNLGIGFLNR